MHGSRHADDLIALQMPGNTENAVRGERFGTLWTPTCRKEVKSLFDWPLYITGSHVVPFADEIRLESLETL